MSIRLLPAQGEKTGDWALTAAVALVPTLVAVAIAVAGHAWGTPRTDDWAFARVAFALHSTGHLHLVGWSQMNLVGLVVWAQPWLWVFGNHLSALDAAGATLAAAGLAASFRLGRRVGGRAAGVLAAGALLMFPGYARDIPTFMTDGPAVAVQALVLAAGAAAISATGRRRRALLAAVLLAGFLGFTIREFAIAAPLAVLFVLRRRPNMTRALVAFLSMSAAWYVWRLGLPGSQPLHGRPGLAAIATVTVQAACTACLGLVPALAWTAGSWWRPSNAPARRRGYLVGATLAVVPVLTAAGTGSPVAWLVGHYLDRAGVNGNVDTLGVRPSLLPASVWALLTVVAVGALVIVCGLVAEWFASASGGMDLDAIRRRLGTESLPSVRPLLAAHVVLAALACAAAGVLNGQIFDRYLWPVVLSGSLLILARYPHRPARRVFVGACAVGALLATVLTLNSVAFDAARWRAGTALVRSGLAAQQVDAGFEWTGAHATAVADLSEKYGGEGAVSWWAKWYPHPEMCAFVSASPVQAPGYRLASTRSWNLLLVAGHERLYLYRAC